MTVDLLVVGSGLTGLFAANLAVDHGLSVHLVSQGRGGLSLSHGCIDIYNSTNPARSIKKLPAIHPYRIVGKDALRLAIRILKAYTQKSDIAYKGGSTQGIPLLSPAGIPFRTSVVPETVLKGRLDDPRPFSIAGLNGFRDFWAASLVKRARQHGVRVHSAFELPLLQFADRRDIHAAGLAKLFGDPSFRSELWRAWKPKLTGAKRVGFPAVFGFLNSKDIIAEAEESLGVDIFEIPTLPPCLPGLRLEALLTQRAINQGVKLIEGPVAKGRIDGRSKGKLAAGIQTSSGGGQHSLDARAVLLATGGFLNGGLTAGVDGSVTESVFNLPIAVQHAVEDWASPHFWETHPYANLGVETDKMMRPLDIRGKAFLENLFAAGGVLHGADRTHEGSRQGIDLASAYQAVKSIRSYIK